MTYDGESAFTDLGNSRVDALVKKGMVINGTDGAAFIMELLWAPLFGSRLSANADFVSNAACHQEMIFSVAGNGVAEFSGEEKNRTCIN